MSEKPADKEKPDKPYTRPAFLGDLKKVVRRLGPDEQHLKKPKGRRRGGRSGGKA